MRIIIALPTRPAPGRVRGSRARGRARPAAPARSAARAGVDAESRGPARRSARRRRGAGRGRSCAARNAVRRRARPRRRSIASSRSSSSRAPSEVSTAGRAVRGSAAGPRSRPDRSRAGVETATSSIAVLGREQLERALDLRPRVARGSRRARRSFWSWPRLSVIPPRVAATVSRAVRRIALIGVVALCCRSAAQRGRARASRKAGHLGPAHLRRAAGLPAHARRARPRPRRRGRACAAPGRRPADRALARALAPAELDRAAAAARPPARGLVRSVDARRADRHRPSRRERLLRPVHRPAARRRSGGRRTSASASWVAPGPGVPVTMIDSGVDLSHEEFAGRPEHDRR